MPEPYVDISLARLLLPQAGAWTVKRVGRGRIQITMDDRDAADLACSKHTDWRASTAILDLVAPEDTDA